MTDTELMTLIDGYIKGALEGSILIREDKLDPLTEQFHNGYDAAMKNLQAFIERMKGNTNG